MAWDSSPESWFVWDRLSQVVSLPLDTLSNFNSSWPETQALNLDLCETVSVKSWVYGLRLLIISLVHGLRLKPSISILWDRLGQVASLRLETLNDFVSSWPETQALNLDFGGTLSLKSRVYGLRLLIISLLHGLRLKPWILILWHRLSQVVSLWLETLNNFVSSWPETQALNLDFMRPSQSSREFTAWDS
jgi:hypothetical protein